LSAVAALSANVGKNIYIPFILVTFIQFIGNVFFSYQFINVDSETFIAWVELVAPIFQFGGIEATNFVAHRRILALLAGGMLPIISLSFLHMLVRFTEEQRLKEIEENTINNNVSTTPINNESADLMEEKVKLEEDAKIKPTEEDLEKIKKIISNFTHQNDGDLPEPSESALSDEDLLKQEEYIFEEADYPDEHFDEEFADEYVEYLQKVGQTKDNNKNISNIPPKPEIKDESWDSVRDEVLNDINKIEKNSKTTTEKNSKPSIEGEKKNL
jgi:acyl carrier protein